jgi:hypothetical protein
MEILYRYICNECGDVVNLSEEMDTPFQTSHTIHVSKRYDWSIKKGKFIQRTIKKPIGVSPTITITGFKDSVRECTGLFYILEERIGEQVI